MHIGIQRRAREKLHEKRANLIQFHIMERFDFSSSPALHSLHMSGMNFFFVYSILSLDYLKRMQDNNVYTFLLRRVRFIH